MTSERSSECLEHDALEALVAGELRLDQHPEIEAHLAECSVCQHIVAAAAAGLEESQDGPLDARDALPKPGDLVAEKYRIESVLGRGGMGTVFAARHGELGQIVAIKMLHSAAPTAAQRFAREAKISAQLSSEHTARVFDLGTADGAPFLVMEHLAGEDLACVIARGRLKPELCVRYALQICEALAEAHAAGIVHRDLKPSNIFVVRRPDGSECVKVLDFGISKRLSREDAEPTRDLTNARVVLGSPAYMSPEQLRHSKEVDARSDLWSLGVVMYELLTGVRPFRAGSLSGLSAAIAADAPPSPCRLVPGVPRALDRIVMRCLRKDREARFRSVDELAGALRRALPATRRSPWRRLLAAAALVPIMALVLLQLASRRAEVRAIAQVMPQPAPAPAAGGLVIQCDAPLPVGVLRTRGPAVPGGASVERDWPLEAVCNGAEGSALRAELGNMLRAAFPTIAVELEPPHPCYWVDVRSESAGLRLALARSQRCPVRLAVTGAGCERIEALEIGTDRTPALATPVPQPVAGAAPARCEALIEVPFEAYGQRLHFSVKPAELRIAPAELSGASLNTTLLGVSSAAAAPSARPPQPPRPPPARPRACIPPQYCRN